MVTKGEREEGQIRSLRLTGTHYFILINKLWKQKNLPLHLGNYLETGLSNVC